MTSAQFETSATSPTLNPASVALARERLVGAQADLHAHAAVPKVERVRVALRSIPDHRHLLGANQRQIGRVVVIHLSHVLSP